MESALLNKVLELPEYQSLAKNITIGEYLELSRECKGIVDLELVRAKTDFFITRDEFKKSLGLPYKKFGG